MSGTNLKVHFSKDSDFWETPDDIFMELHQEFDFTVDGAANSDNCKLPRFIGPGGEEEDFLKWEPKDERIWLNPPYSKCSSFVAHAAYLAGNRNCIVVMLVPSRTDTRWFHDFCWQCENSNYNYQVRFRRGRVKFLTPDEGKPKHPAPFPSMVVVFKPKVKEKYLTFEQFKIPLQVKKPDADYMRQLMEWEAQQQKDQAGEIKYINFDHT